MALPPRERLRLFVALELPDHVRAGLGRTIEPFLAVPSFRWVPPANYHVTVRFLGSVQEPRLRELTASLSEVARRSVVFRTKITGFGSFPGGGGPARVLWAGLDDGSGSLAALASQVEARLSGWFPAQGADYTPHVTLARCDPPREAPEDWHATQFPAEPFNLRWLTLFQSRFGAQGPRYERLQRFPFRG